MLAETGQEPMFAKPTLQGQNINLARKATEWETRAKRAATTEREELDDGMKEEEKEIEK